MSVITRTIVVVILAADARQALSAFPRQGHLIPPLVRICSVRIPILQKGVGISPCPGNFPGKDDNFSLILRLR